MPAEWPRAALLAASGARTRRDHMKYLTLIRAIALLHQHQRERKTIDHNGEKVEYIEVTRDDIALADRLAGEVEWAVAYYDSLATPWHRTVPLLNRTPLRGHLGAKDADAFYYDPAARAYNTTFVPRRCSASTCARGNGSCVTSTSNREYHSSSRALSGVA